MSFRKPRSVVSLGIFDGFHLGHQHLVNQVVENAQGLKFISTIFTFDPHPANVHNGPNAVELLYSVDKRVEFLYDCEVDNVVVLPYSLEFAQQSALEFAKKYFVEYANASLVIVGEDTRFGKNNSAGVDELVEIGKELGFRVMVVEDVKDEDSNRYSSTKIRSFLANGAVDEATNYLGRPFEVFSKVVHGFKNGRKIGYPTANLDIDLLNIIPKDGVYAGYLTCEGEVFPCAISVGTNYQFEAVSRSVEAHVLGRGDLDFYGKDVSVSFVQYLRPMFKFNSLDDLLAQMRNDVCVCAQILSVPVPDPIDPTSVFAGM